MELTASSFFHLLALYKWTIAAGGLAAATLALLGAQLAARDKSMLTLCVGQGAMLGVLCGLGIAQTWTLPTAFSQVGPFFTALIFSGLTIWLTEGWLEKKTASKNTFFTFVFSLLLAAGYLVSSLFPALEGHLAQVYFGDLATLTTGDAEVASAISGVALIYLLLFSNKISNRSFESSLFGASQTRFDFFPLLTLLVLSYCVQFVGFLFTVACLFLPTSMMSYLATKGLTRHLRVSAILAGSATVIGFALSLAYPRLPTVPTIVMLMFLEGCVVLALERLMALFFSTRPSAALNPVVAE